MFVDEKKHGEATPGLGTLRVDRILMLADEIEKPMRGLHFDMHLWHEPRCGSACCIGGHAQFMFTDVIGGLSGDEVLPAARAALGLSSSIAQALFFPPEPHLSCRDRAKAARVLRHLAATGEVDWSLA